MIDAGAELLDVVAELGEDERRVILVLARRLLAGQSAYGRLDLANDARDWKRERAEEVQDLLIYSAFETLKQDARRAPPGPALDEDLGEPARGDLVFIEVKRACG